MLLVDFEKLNSEICKKVLNFCADFGNIYVENSFFVGVKRGSDFFVLPQKISESGLKEILKITGGGQKACYKG